MLSDEELSQLQEEVALEIASPESENGAILAFDVGLGKTRTGLLAAKALGARVILVAAPLSTTDNPDDGWIPWCSRVLPDLPVRRIENNKAGRAALTAFTWRQAGVYLIGHEYWERLAWTREEYKTKRKVWDEDRKMMVPEVKTRKVRSETWTGDGFMFIYDEGHRSSGEWTNRALLNLDPGVFKLSMSGTPWGDKFENAHPHSRWVWPHRTDIIPKDRFDWINRWAKTKYDKFAPRNIKVVGEKEEGAFVAALPCYIRVESDLPQSIRKEVWVDLYPEQRRVYDELEQKMVAWINDNPLVTTISVSRRARWRQMALAMPDVDFDEETGEVLVDFPDDAESAKLDALFAEIEGRGELGQLLVDQSLVILTDSQKFARLATMRLNERYGDCAREWSGAIPRKERPANKHLFLERKIKYIVGVQAAMGTGTDGLQAVCNIGVFMSLADWRTANVQGIGRWRRRGQTEQTYDVYIGAKGTVDTGQFSTQTEAALKMNRSLKRQRKDAT